MGGHDGPELPFAGVRVVEMSSGIAAAYCGKMFVDAGADVVKIESAQGDPMRSASAPLFGYLAAGKRSVVATGPAGSECLLAGADLVLTDLTMGESLDDVTAKARRAAVVVAVTPFGTTGPYVENQVLANEFILQALCGSIAGRGWPESEPIQAGGRLGEWLAGSYAAVTAAASVRHARNGGGGAVIDVSTYEAMVVAMGSLPAMSISVLGPDAPLQQRSLELPSVVPTADGLVGLCTITAQQFQDFLLLIERPDLLDDSDLASMPGRVRRRDEFLSAVHDWSRRRTTDEIIELAAALRIPVAPIGTPSTLLAIDHFEQRGVFVASQQGGVQPRVPYRSESIGTRAPAAAPELGQHTGQLHWPPRPPAPAGGNDGRPPLGGIRVLDFTAFWAGPLATQLLAALGADVIKVEGVRRPDGMRFAGGRPPTTDQWWEWGPVFLCSNSNKRGVSIELGTPQGRQLALGLIAHSDLVVENFSPRVMTNFDLEWDAVRSANPGAILLRMPAFGLDGPWRDRVGFAQTMEQATGMAWMTGHRQRPPVIPRGVCDPIAGVHAAFAAVAALTVRDRDGSGMQVESTMVEAALNVAAETVLEYTTRGVELHRQGNRGPGASPQGVYRCRGDDEWVALAVIADASWPSFADLIGRPDLGVDSALDTRAGRCEKADDIDRCIEAWARLLNVEDAVTLLRDRGVAAAPVATSAAVLRDPHLRARGFWETVDHPVVGEYRCTGMPFAYLDRPRRWIRKPPPLYGEHTDEVLTQVLGLARVDQDALRAMSITCKRPAGL